MNNKNLIPGYDSSKKLKVENTNERSMGDNDKSINTEINYKIDLSKVTFSFYDEKKLRSIKNFENNFTNFLPINNFNVYEYFYKKICSNIFYKNNISKFIYSGKEFDKEKFNSNSVMEIIREKLGLTNDESNDELWNNLTHFRLQNLDKIITNREYKSYIIAFEKKFRLFTVPDINGNINSRRIILFDPFHLTMKDKNKWKYSYEEHRLNSECHWKILKKLVN